MDKQPAFGLAASALGGAQTVHLLQMNSLLTGPGASPAALSPRLSWSLAAVLPEKQRLRWIFEPLLKS